MTEALCPCGREGCAEPRATLCVLCAHIRPHHKPRHYRDPQACITCRRVLGETLAAIPGQWRSLPTALLRGRGSDVKVSGGAVEAPLPFAEDAWDLLQPARHPRIAAWLDDQIGHLPVATTLELWVRDWCDVRGRGERGPDPTVRELATWLSHRLDWACDEHPAVDDFAAEIRNLSGVLRGLVGTETARPQPILGVPCRRCDLKTLARLSDGSGKIECQNRDCHTIYLPDEYRQWVALVAAGTKPSDREKEGAIP